jgi:DNA processing protein
VVSALATVVVEAAERSGSRMQARLALRRGRHVFLMRSLLEHEWAGDYAERPGVTVVETAADVFAGLQRLASEPADLIWA